MFVYVPGLLNLPSEKYERRLPLHAVTEISVRERTYTLYDGGMQRRLCIHTDTADWLLVTKKPDATAQFLNSAVFPGTPRFIDGPSRWD